MYFSGFIDDNPSSTLSKVRMMEMYTFVLTVQKAFIFVNQSFNQFYTDNNGSIDFKGSVQSRNFINILSRLDITEFSRAF